MASKKALNAPGASYRISDRIENLRIRVKFSKITSRLNESEKSKAAFEECEFRWHKKLFSPNEKVYFADIQNCTSDIERKYNEELNRSKSTFKNQILFSLLEEDKYNGVVVKELTVTSNNSGAAVLDLPGAVESEVPISYAGECIHELRRRQSHHPDSRENYYSGQGPLPKISVVLDSLSEEQRQNHHFLLTPTTTMYIMADLDEAVKNSRIFDPNATGEDQAETSDETNDPDLVVLCAVTLDSKHNVLMVKPDFNDGDKPYTVASRRGLGHFEYTLTHGSKQMSKLEREDEIKQEKEKLASMKEKRFQLNNTEFDRLPDEGQLRMIIFGEIVSASNFEYDNLYIHYFLDVPSDWYLQDFRDQISGTTQISKSVVEDRVSTSYFCFPFEFELFYAPNKYPSSDSPKWPVLFFEVLSIDSWTRYRTEGYGYLKLPSNPGCQSHVINCWRPVGNSVVNELRRFFIGGSPELEDSTYVAVPPTFDGSHLGKYGFRTESAGTITLRLNSLHHSKEFYDYVRERKDFTSDYSADNFDGISHINIMGVIRAYEQAKAKLVKVREAFDHTVHDVNGCHKEE